MINLTRNCPICDLTINYKTNYGFSKSIKNNSLCSSCAAKKRFENKNPNDGFLFYTKKENTSGENNPFYGKKHSIETKDNLKKIDKSYMKNEEYRHKMSNLSSGSKNSMFGKTVYGQWIKKYGKKAADRLFLEFKQKQSKNSSGENNPMYGKPSPQGSGNGWSGWYKNWFFRSIRELSYVIYLDENNIEWESGEKIVINYIDYKGNKRTYRPDFIVGNKIIEIKPIKLTKSKLFNLKKCAAEDYCKLHGMIFESIDPIPLSNSKIKFLFENGTISFTEKYKKLYLEKFL